MAQGRAALVQSPVGDLVVSQGSDNTYRYRYGTRAAPDAPVEYVDLTGWAGRAQVRPRPGGDVWLSVTTEAPTDHGSTLTLDADGFVTLHVHHSETEQPAWNSPARAKGAWDLELVAPNGEVVRLVMGEVLVSADVTR
ncbi:hypothetical protein [Cellulomonas sp.]|uniref:hypothetical protein n=1 Tax=Cellulomonas sp. TaxID=40001 RepID=UPI001B2154FB|nr:hypothetical protein [Cellulomonas sp.]MBO9555601.1 hypothetical protein [Cellulomonas sp.]